MKQTTYENNLLFHCFVLIQRKNRLYWMHFSSKDFINLLPSNNLNISISFTFFFHWLTFKNKTCKKIKIHLFQTINKGFSLKASNTMLTTNNLKTGQNKLCLRYVFRELEAFWENYSQSPSQLRARQNIA